MTQNEIEERSDAQAEKCQLCRHRTGTGCVSGGRQKLPSPPKDYAFAGHVTAYDYNFRDFGNSRLNILAPWQPVLATSSCVGYERRHNP